MEHPSLCPTRPVLQRTAMSLPSFHPFIHPQLLCPGQDWMNELSAGKAPSLFLGSTPVESNRFCLVLVSSDPSCGSIVSSSTALQSTRWEVKRSGPLTWTLSHTETLRLSARVWVACVRGWGGRGWWRRVWGGATGAETWRLGVRLCCRFLCWRKHNTHNQDHVVHIQHLLWRR